MGFGLGADRVGSATFTGGGTGPFSVAGFRALGVVVAVVPTGSELGDTAFAGEA